jgi:hypothetical protein
VPKTSLPVRALIAADMSLIFHGFRTRTGYTQAVAREARSPPLPAPTPTSGGLRWGGPPFHPHLWGMASRGAQRLVAGLRADWERAGGGNGSALVPYAAPGRTPGGGANGPSGRRSEGAGESLLAHSVEPDPAAEICFHRALDVARRQRVKSLELRAAMNLSRLWLRQGMRAEARQLPAAVYHWFTEGFETADWQEVRMLLAGLV